MTFILNTLCLELNEHLEVRLFLNILMSKIYLKDINRESMIKLNKKGDATALASASGKVLIKDKLKAPKQFAFYGSPQRIIQRDNKDLTNWEEEYVLTYIKNNSEFETKLNELNTNFSASPYTSQLKNPYQEILDIIENIRRNQREKIGGAKKNKKRTKRKLKKNKNKRTRKKN